MEENVWFVTVESPNGNVLHKLEINSETTVEEVLVQTCSALYEELGARSQFLRKKGEEEGLRNKAIVLSYFPRLEEGREVTLVMESREGKEIHYVDRPLKRAAIARSGDPQESRISKAKQRVLSLEERSKKALQKTEKIPVKKLKSRTKVQAAMSAGDRGVISIVPKSEQKKFSIIFETLPSWVPRNIRVFQITSSMYTASVSPETLEKLLHDDQVKRIQIADKIGPCLSSKSPSSKRPVHW